MKFKYPVTNQAQVLPLLQVSQSQGACKWPWQSP